MCYCEHCRTGFRAFNGLELPRTAAADSADGSDETRQQYRAWERDRLFELYSLWDAEIRKLNPDAAFFPNGFEQIRSRAAVPILFADRQARSGDTPAWQNGKFAKEARSVFGSKPIVGLFSVGLEAPYRWKDSVRTRTRSGCGRWMASPMASVRGW